MSQSPVYGSISESNIGSFNPEATPFIPYSPLSSSLRADAPVFVAPAVPMVTPQFPVLLPDGSFDPPAFDGSLDDFEDEIALPGELQSSVSTKVMPVVMSAGRRKVNFSPFSYGIGQPVDLRGNSSSYEVQQPRGDEVLVVQSIEETFEVQGLEQACPLAPLGGLQRISTSPITHVTDSISEYGADIDDEHESEDDWSPPLHSNSKLRIAPSHPGPHYAGISKSQKKAPSKRKLSKQEEEAIMEILTMSVPDKQKKAMVVIKEQSEDTTIAGRMGLQVDRPKKKMRGASE